MLYCIVVQELNQKIKPLKHVFLQFLDNYKKTVLLITFFCLQTTPNIERLYACCY